MVFQNRKEAGIKLAEALSKFKDDDVIVFALPRGGVVLGVEIAEKLDAPLDLVITKKIGHPFNSEYAIGAVAESGEPLYNAAELRRVDASWRRSEEERMRAELKRRRRDYFGDREQEDLAGKVAIIVDDGIATGLTMMAAIKYLRGQGAERIVVAIPVTPYDTAQRLREQADDLVSLQIDRYYRGAVGAYYKDFRQVSDEEVIALLRSVEG
ncbi:MAG: phosphoribosyltransferase family protein [Saccharofermentanales bacterium]|jgi:predicted phosphoribosyltransferase|nr:phosphoribosyltransferase family protein [Eubacteriales bacterium]HHU03967.1 phosphoribosyl transferase [Fastidiosipila sp.]